VLIVYISIHIWIARNNRSFTFPKINEEDVYFYNEKLPNFGIAFEKLSISSEFGSVEACAKKKNKKEDKRKRKTKPHKLK
jgi:hypothetical protein